MQGWAKLGTSWMGHIAGIKNENPSMIIKLLQKILNNFQGSINKFTLGNKKEQQQLYYKKNK